MPHHKLNLRGSPSHGSSGEGLKLRGSPAHKPSGSGLLLRGRTVVQTGDAALDLRGLTSKAPSKGTEHPFSRSSPVKTKIPFSKAKAKEILSEEKPTLKGKPITKKQRGLLGLIAGGGKPSKRKGFKG